MKTRGIINAIIGIWFVIAPWMLGFHTMQELLQQVLYLEFSKSSHLF
ncbi:SPW repeat protein [Priestia megaterium]